VFVGVNREKGRELKRGQISSSTGGVAAEKDLQLTEAARRHRKKVGSGSRERCAPSKKGALKTTAQGRGKKQENCAGTDRRRNKAIRGKGPISPGRNEVEGLVGGPLAL